MTKNILKMAAIGLIVVTVVIGVIFVANRGAQIRLEGSIQKVRTQRMDDRSCVVLVDFRFVNPARYPFVVRNATIHLETAEGVTLTGSTVAATDLRNVFKYYSKVNPDLGEMYNDVLLAKDRIGAGEALDRMLGARFGIPEADARSRRSLTLRIEDVDGAVTEIREEPKSE